MSLDTAVLIEPEIIVFDSKPLNGLRGILSCHILVFHSLFYSDKNFNIYGQVHMPLFFLLSGFCLTLGYGKKKYSKVCGCCCNSNQSGSNPDSNENIFDSATFYFGRLTRILPIYYICFLYSLPLIPILWQWSPNVIGGSISAVFLVQTWIIVLGFGPDGPSWTISTLFFFYLVYPRLLIFAQKQSNPRLAVWMASSFFLEIVVGFSISGLATLISPDGAYWFSTAHPISRLPVFFMGVCAGVLCVRIQTGDLEALNQFGRANENCLLSYLEDNFFPFPYCRKTENEAISAEVKQKSWKRRTDLNNFGYFGLLIFLAIFNILYTFDVFHRLDDKNEIAHTVITDIGDNEAKNGTNHPADVVIFKDAMFGAILQFTACYTQLMIIVGLCLDNGKSISSQFFNTKLMQFLGRISMSLYLFHEPLIYWITVCLRALGWDDWNSDIEYNQKENPNPIWTVPIHIILSLFFASILTIYVEEPARKWLKTVRDRRINVLQNVETT